MKRKLDLQTPTPATSGASFDTRPRRVRKWASELPTANLGELGKRLNEALQQVNAQSTSTRRLFHFLEAVGPAAQLVLSHLQRQYTHQPLPLNAAGSRAAQLAVELLTELLRGYRAVLRAIVPDKEETSNLRLVWYRRELVHTLHRFVHYGEQMLEVYRVLHMEPPEGLWRRIHRCYRLAEAHNLERKRVRRCEEKAPRTAIGDQYRRLLLSALLPAGTLAPVQQREIAATLDHWARLLQLPHPAAGIQANYYVRLARDQGPLAVAGTGAETLNSDNTRLLDSRELCETFEFRLKRDGKGRWWRREPDLDPATLNFLRGYWCSVKNRREQRDEVDVPAEVAIGLGALFHLTGGVSKPNAPASPGASITLEPMPETGGNWMGKRTEADVWQGIYGETAKHKRAAPVPVELPKSDPSYTAVAGRVVDRSEHGLAVVIAREALRMAAIGMPVAVRTEGSDWLVGTAMRLNNRGEEVELGIQIVLHGALPARLCTRDGTRISPYFDVVIGRTLDGLRAVAAPSITALRSGEPTLEVGGNTVEAQRGATLTQSRYLDAFVIELTDHVSLETVRQAAKKASAAVTDKPAPVVTTPPPKVRVPREQRVEELVVKTGLSRADAEFIIDAETEAGADD